MLLQSPSIGKVSVKCLYTHGFCTLEEYVTVIPWASWVYGVCTLRAVLCICMGEPKGIHKTAGRLQTHTPAEAHGMTNLYHDAKNRVHSYDKNTKVAMAAIP